MKKVNKFCDIAIRIILNLLQILGEFCKPCQCSGNIDPLQQGSCDTVTGECLRCLNNTFGKACALCAPGFYGDAINLKNCQGKNRKDFLKISFWCLCTPDNL